ncbi:MAG: hypothetical protein HYT87_08045 [Nitrospirae bacterium]|nr:hypothetical protein [Nitrospirota bacterium]
MADRIEGFDTGGGLRSSARVQQGDEDRQRRAAEAEDRRRREDQAEALRQAEQSRGRGRQLDTLA